MNFLKKNYKIIIFSFVIIVTVISFCIILFHEEDSKCEFITVKNDYYLVNSNCKNALNVPLFISFKDSIFVDLNEIKSCSLVTVYEEEVIPLTLNSIKYLDTVSYEDKDFYEYDFCFNVDFIVEDLTLYDQIYLKLNYESGPFIKILLGSITIYNYAVNDEVFYTNLKGITRKFNDKIILSNVLIKLNASSDIEIVNIKTLNSHVSVDLEKSHVINYINEEETPLNELIDYEYNIIGQGNINNSIIIKNDDYLLLYLKYDSYIELSTQGFVISYYANDKLCEKVVTPFMFFNSNNLNSEIVKVEYEADFN